MKSEKGMQLYQIFMVLVMIIIAVIVTSTIFSSRLKQQEIVFREIEVMETKNMFYLLNKSLSMTWLVSTAQVTYKAGESGLDPTIDDSDTTSYWYYFDRSRASTGIVLPGSGERCNSGNPRICLPQNINFRNYFMGAQGKMNEYTKIPGTPGSNPEKISVKGREITLEPMLGMFWPSYGRITAEVAPKISIETMDTKINTVAVENADIRTDFQKMLKAGWMAVGISAKFRKEVEEGKHSYSGPDIEYKNKIRGIFESGFNDVRSWLGTWSAQIKSEPAHEGNFQQADRGTNDIDAIVIHYCAGSYESCKEWFRNPYSQASAHYVISRAGEVTQMVQDKDVAWHSTYYNERSIGIELEGSGEQDDYTDAMYNSMANLIVRLTSKYLNINKEHPADNSDAASAASCLDAAGIVGHSQVQPNDALKSCGYTNIKSDPGTNFDWDRLMNLVNSASGYPATSFVGLKAGYVPEPYSTIFIDASEKYGAPPALIAAIFKCGEHSIYRTGFLGDATSDLSGRWPDANGPWASSPAGAQGPFQFMPATWSAYGEDCGGGKDIQSLPDAACSASNMLKQNMDSNEGDYETKIKKAIYAYNHADWYVDRVYACYQQLLGARQEGIFADWQWKALELVSEDGKTYLHYNASVIFTDGRSVPGIKIGSELFWPTTGKYIASCYGVRYGVLTAEDVGEYHGGIDIIAPIGSDVYAAADGRVVFVYPTLLSGWCDDSSSDCNHGYGNQVTIEHVDANGKRFYTQYTHLKKNSIAASVGEDVMAGEKIAESGNSGKSTAPHLHFEINTGQEKKDSTSVNPCIYLDCSSAGGKKCPKAPAHHEDVSDSDMPAIGETGGYALIDGDCTSENEGKFKCSETTTFEKLVRGHPGPYILKVCKNKDFAYIDKKDRCQDARCRDCLNILQPPEPDEIRLMPTGESQLLSDSGTTPEKYELKPQENELLSCWGDANGKKNYGLKLKVAPGEAVYPVEDGVVAKVCRLGDSSCRKEYGNYVVIWHENPGGLGFYTQYNHLASIDVEPTTSSGHARAVLAMGKSGSDYTGRRDAYSVLGHAGSSGVAEIMVFFPSSNAPNFRYIEGRDPLCLFSYDYLTDKIAFSAPPLAADTELTAYANIQLPRGSELQACLDSLARKNCDYTAIKKTDVEGEYYYHNEELNVFDKKPFTLRFNAEDWVAVG